MNVQVKADVRTRDSWVGESTGVLDPGHRRVTKIAVREQPTKRTDGSADRRRQEATTAGSTVTGAAAPPSVPRDRMLRAGQFAWSAVGLAAALGLAVFTLSAVRTVVVPLALALFPATALAPAVSWLKARRVPRTLAAFAVVLTALAVACAVVALVATQVTAQFAALRSSVASGMQHVEQVLARGPLGLPPVRLGSILAEVRAGGGGGTLLTGLFGAAHVAEHLLIAAILAVVALFFYLRDGAAIFGWLRDLCPPHLRRNVQDVGQEIWDTIGSYVRGQLLVAVTNTVLVSLGLVLFGVPLVPALAALTFVGCLVPIVGLLVAGAAAVLVTLAEADAATAALVLGLIVVIHQLEVHVLAPLVQSRRLRLHPFAVIVSLAAGATLTGVLGALVAVPVTASAARTIAVLRSRHRDVMHQSASGREFSDE